MRYPSAFARSRPSHPRCIGYMNRVSVTLNTDGNIKEKFIDPNVHFPCLPITAAAAAAASDADADAACALGTSRSKLLSSHQIFHLQLMMLNDSQFIDSFTILLPKSKGSYLKGLGKSLPTPRRHHATWCAVAHPIVTADPNRSKVGCVLTFFKLSRRRYAVF